MRVKKVLNNNVVIAEDSEHKEYVVCGLGLAYLVGKNKPIPPEKIERIFTSVDEKNLLCQLVDSIPQRYFNIAVKIIEFAQKALDVRLNDRIYITLSDHICFVAERVQKGILPQNSLKWEIKQYYQKEFKISEVIRKMLEEELECVLNDDETASIALHLVNAELENESIHDSMISIQLMDQIMQIIRYHTDLVESEGDLNYQRMITHIKFFVQRVLAKHQLNEENPLYKMVQNSYPEEFIIAQKIRNFVEQKIKHSISDDEVTYLVIHIARIRIKHNE